ncbi:MAG: hypothetical protein JOZ54_23080 [Acidobacteria bacterium]|nr:hypothetical protein [Acidobacteriota bacterium]
MKATVGVVENANTATLVTIGPDGALLDRRHIALTEPDLPTHPHHHEGSWAVGRYLETPGARSLPLAEAVALVDCVRAAAERGARNCLSSLAAAVPLPIATIAIRACPTLPPTTEERIRDHRAQTYADSVMYRHALADAATALGWSVFWYDRDRLLEEVPQALLTAMGRAAGTPWQAKHKLAAAAALAARDFIVQGSGS